MVKQIFVTLFLSVVAFANVAFAEIKMVDCEVNGHSFSVPEGQCEKLQAGDFSGVDEELKQKIQEAH